MEWNMCKNGLPLKSGKYLVIRLIFKHLSVDTMYFASDLSNLDQYSFKYKKRPGFYDFDSEYGYYEVDKVIAWGETPEIPREIREQYN